MPQNKEQSAVEVFKALGDLTRFKILKLILSSGNNLCVTALSKKLGISQPVISQHLKILKNAGLVNPSRKGYFIHYRVNLKTIVSVKDQIVNFLELPVEKHTKSDCIRVKK
jgi:ArsR family transcriptional regulator, arsenate/arsenite/antimonite-responsive transcriptional repressor